MHTTKYLIVGAGMTGDMAAKGIRDNDPDGSITLIGADPHPPYKRPLLTKGLWKGAPEEKLWREPAEGVELVTGCRIVSLDLAAGTATDDAGEDYSWEKGVEVLGGEMVSSASGDRVETGSGRTLEADAVVAGLGVIPDTELAEAAGLEVDDGIVVDEYGRVPGHENVFAAGDVARFPVRALGTTMRIEHEDHANTHGRAVGANMAGAETPYDHLPFFYSDLFDL